MANKRGSGAKHAKKQADKIRKAREDYKWADAADDGNSTIAEAKRMYNYAPLVSADDDATPADTERRKSNDLAAKQEKADIKNSGRLEVEGAPKPRKLKRMAKGGMCRGGGKATRGLKFSGVK